MSEQPQEPGLPVMLTQGVPDKEIVVTEGVTIAHGDGDERREYSGGETFTLSGPTADVLVMNGQATYA